MFSFSELFSQRMFRSASIHRPQSAASQRAALHQWARKGRRNSVPTPRDFGSNGSRRRRGGGVSSERSAATHAGSSAAFQATGDAGGTLYDGLSHVEGAVPLSKEQGCGNKTRSEKNFPSDGEERKSQQKKTPEHGSWEWEREMIRRRAEASIRKGHWTPPPHHFAHPDNGASASSSSSVPRYDDELGASKNNDDAEMRRFMMDHHKDNDEEDDDDHEDSDSDDFDDHGGASQERASSSGFSVYFPPETATPEEKQAAFDDFLERAVVLFAPPHRDALRTAEMQQLLSRACPEKPFRPLLFGSPELLYLLRNSCFLKAHRGRWAFVRQFDPERESVTVKLEAYRYRELPSQDDGVRSAIPIFQDREKRLWS